MRNKKHVSRTIWPFKAVWDLLIWIIRLAGRLIAVVVGLVIAVAGLALTIPVISAPTGSSLMGFRFSCDGARAILRNLLVFKML